ncbi:MAG: hypothetical protein ACYC6Y_18000 [Thermoguttaceae bacterium]
MKTFDRPPRKNRDITPTVGELGLTDCISFIIMREYGLTDALTADHHFEQAGFTVLLK